MKYIMMMILLVLPVQAHADWSNTGMHPMGTPNLAPNQGQTIHQELHVNAVPSARVEPQHRVEQARPAQQHYAAPVVNHAQAVRQEQHRAPAVPEYFRHDSDYYGHGVVPFPYADVDSTFVVPDGFESVVVDGQIYLL